MTGSRGASGTGAGVTGADGQGRWPVGQAQVDAMLIRGEIEEVIASAEHAQLLLDQAGRHLVSAEPLVQADPPSALTLIYDGARKSLAAVLAKQGLRATSKGGHIAVQRAVEAQLGNQARAVIRAFGRLRRERNANEYPAVGHVPITGTEAQDALGDAEQIVTAMRQFEPKVGPWRQ